jgi:hypothetical protein
MTLASRPAPPHIARVLPCPPPMPDGQPEPLRVHLAVWSLGILMALWFTNYLYGWVDLGQLLRQ